MTYSTLLDDETVASNFLCIIRPRRRAAGFTLFSGSVYVADFDYGEVIQAFNGTTELTLGASVSLNADEFYYDVTAEQLYVRLNSGADPDTIWLIAEYEMYFGTFDAHHYRDPDDNTTRVVYYEPLIAKSPVIKQSVSDSLFGFNPVQTLSISLNNTEHLFDRHLHDGSFNDAEIELWHWLGDLSTDNVSLVLNGTVKNISLNQPLVEISLCDRVDILQKEWRHPTGDSFFSTSTFANVDPNYIGRPIRAVYGLCDGFIPVNVDYVDDAPTTSDNREWVVSTGQSNLSNLTVAVSASPASTATRTYVASVDGFNVDDAVWLDKATDEYAIITAVGANYIDHTTIVTPAASGEFVKRGFVGNITIVQNGVPYLALYNRDYTINGAMAGTTSGFTFSTSLEANLSIPNTLSPSDQVFCRVYGPTNFVTLGGPAFGSNDTRTNNMNHPAQLVLDILKRHLGVAEASLDSASFTAALTNVADGMTLVVPEDSISNLPKYRDVISEIVKSSLMRLIVNAAGEFSLSTYQPMGAATKTIEDDEILFDSISFDYDYDELVSNVTIEYNRQEASTLPFGGERVNSVSATSDIATYLHKAAATKTERSLWRFEAEAQSLADRLAFVFGDRIGKVNLNTKNRFFDSKLGDIILVQRTYLPGNDVDGETEYSRKYAVSAVSKGITGVTLELDDQKGCEDNSGSW